MPPKSLHAGPRRPGHRVTGSGTCLGKLSPRRGADTELQVGRLERLMLFMLPIGLAQAGIYLAGIRLGLVPPITAMQFLWIDGVGAVTLVLALASEALPIGLVSRPPRIPFAALLAWRAVFVALLLGGGLLGLFWLELRLGSSLEAARTAAINGLAAGEIAYLFNSRSILASAMTRWGFLANRSVYLATGALAALQALLTYAAPLQAKFGTVALDGAAWGRIGLLGLLLFLLVELEKLAWRRGMRRPAPAVVSAGTAGKVSLIGYAWISIAAAIATIALKTVAWRLTASVGLLSDALESLVNLVSAIMALAMLTVAATPPDDDHHFGHGKAEYFSSGLEGALILVAAVGIAVTAFDRLLHPQALEELSLGLAISTLASLVNFGVAWVLLKAGRQYGSIVLEADAKHLFTDVWTSVGVLLGLGAVALTGWRQLDSIIAFLVAINIVWSGVALLKRSVAGLLDATLPPEENARIDAVLDRYRKRGIEFHDIRTRQSGTDRFMTVHVLVPGKLTVKEGHDLVDRLEAEICRAIGEITVISHLEPLDDPASFSHGGSDAGLQSGRVSLSAAVDSRKSPPPKQAPQAGNEVPTEASATLETAAVIGIASEADADDGRAGRSHLSPWLARSGIGLIVGGSGLSMVLSGLGADLAMAAAALGLIAVLSSAKRKSRRRIE